MSPLEEIRQQAGLLLDNVGATKAVGYLPLYTIERVLGQNPAELVQHYRQKGLCVRVFDQNECCIKSGALFVWDYDQASRCIKEFGKSVTEKGWPIDANVVLENIATEWFEKDDPIMPLVYALYGELRMTKNPGSET
jgi:hypothetical protein